jgi:hypothetical protein
VNHLGLYRQDKNYIVKFSFCLHSLIFETLLGRWFKGAWRLSRRIQPALAASAKQNRTLQKSPQAQDLVLKAENYKLF